LAHDAPKWYDDQADHPQWIKALADVRRQATLEGYCYPHVQAIIVAIDQYAEAALGNREYFLNRAIPDWLKQTQTMITQRMAAFLTVLSLWSAAAPLARRRPEDRHARRGQGGQDRGVRLASGSTGAGERA
jgi:hypothetical protein